MKRNIGIAVKYIYSACILTSTDDIRILHDPWFSEGVYDGSWFQYPKVENPISAIGDVDCIYISHIHPDHYDSKFLHQYFEQYGKKKILISNHVPNFLLGKMKADGFDPTVVDSEYNVGNTSINIIPHITGSSSDIDSVIIIKYKGKEKLHCVVNANDIIFDEPMKVLLKQKAGDIDILLCGYTGAGPYPQTYFDVDDDRLKIEADKKKETFFIRYKKLIDHMGAKVNIPFAGKYILGGHLAHLNDYRGVADPVEILDKDKNAIVLADVEGEINTLDFIPTAVRKEKYNKQDIENRILEVGSYEMDYERLIDKEEIDQLPLKRLLAKAMNIGLNNSGCQDDYYFCFYLPSGEVAVLNANKSEKESIKFLKSKDDLPKPRSEIIIDPRYLFGLLTNIYHWNNAEVGSQFYVRRFPNEFNRDAQRFLNFLSL